MMIETVLGTWLFAWKTELFVISGAIDQTTKPSLISIKMMNENDGESSDEFN